MKILGDVARYHGGDLQGKQVQKLLDDTRNKDFKILECVKSEVQIYEKFVRALETLADVIDALKMPTELFQEEDIKAITYLCESWGNQWPTDFGHRNITPKGHILSFVLPKAISELRTFYKFYKVEQKGESIHADLNDIEQKVWCIRKKEDKL